MFRPPAIRCYQLAAVILGLAMSQATTLCAEQPDDFVRIHGCRLKFADTILLASERTGVVAAVAAAGEMVAAGDDVARLRDGVLRASRAIAAKQAENDVEIRFARKSAELTQLKYDRASQANAAEPGTVSELELREMRLAAEKASLQFEQAEHVQAIAQLKLAEMDATLETLHLRAPYNVFVRAAAKHPGEVVQQGEVIAEVVNTSRVRVEGYANLADARYLRVGETVHLELGEGGPQAATFPAAISFVDVKIEPVSQRIRFAAEANNERGQLREGLTVTVLVPRQPQSAMKQHPERAR